MNNPNEITCSSIRDTMPVIHYETPNAETIEAMEEVKKLKADPYKKTYNSFSEIIRDAGNAI